MDLKVKYKKRWEKPKLALIKISKTQNGTSGLDDGFGGQS